MVEPRDDPSLGSISPVAGMMSVHTVVSLAPDEHLGDGILLVGMLRASTVLG